MKVIFIILISILGLNLKAQIKAEPQQISEKYLMPINDTMDVIRIPYTQVKNFTMDVGKYSRIEPVVVDTLNPTAVHFLPHRCLYDPDMVSIRTLLNTMNKRYYIISQKKLIIKPGQIEP